MKILGGLLGPPIEGAAGAGGEDILCGAGTATVDAGTRRPRHSHSFRETCSPSQKNNKKIENIRGQLSLRTGAGGKTLFFSKGPLS